MPYICLCQDHPESAETRKASTADHLEYIETILDRILVAGPLVDDGSGSYNASCFVYDTDDLNEATGLLHNDPYFKAGLYDRVEFHRFRPAAGGWIGGMSWK